MADSPEADRIRRLVSKIKQDDKARNTWREKQAAWYRMRSVGIGRASLPFRGAADFHWPLADTFIEKLKPFYYQQALQPDPLCSFVPTSSDTRALSTIIAQWFDYKVRTQSNFRKALPVLIDLMLERGKSVMKIVWDHDGGKLSYEAIDPVHIIVPPYTECLGDAERLTHIIYIPRSDYLRRAKECGWNQDIEFIRAACSKEDNQIETDQDREWITGVYDDEHSRELMTLWEIYEKQDDGKYRVDLISPNKPDEPVRDGTTMVPYSHGKAPFAEVNYEIKSRCFFENRGIPEIIGQFEQELCKLENEKLDYMTFCNRPLFTNNGASINVQNLRIAPGQVIGQGLTAVEMPQPPISFDKESMNIRSIAEQRIGMPDFGIGRSSDFSQPRTAKEAEMLQQYNNQGVDLRGRVFDESLSDIYNQSYSLLLQYGKDSLDFTYRHEYSQIGPDALSDAYVIQPNGNPDGYDKNREITKLTNLLSIPWVQQHSNMEAAAKAVFELADARYVREIFLPGAGTQNQYEKQCSEIGDMLNGFQLSINPDDDDGQHLKSLLNYFDFCQGNNIQVPIWPSFLLYSHAMQHYEAYAQKNPPGFKADKHVLDQAKGRMEQAMPILQQALMDGLPKMANLQQVEAHLKQIQGELHPNPLGPVTAPTGQPSMPPQGQPVPAGPPQPVQ